MCKVLREVHSGWLTTLKMDKYRHYWMISLKSWTTETGPFKTFNLTLLGPATANLSTLVELSVCHFQCAAGDTETDRNKEKRKFLWTWSVVMSPGHKREGQACPVNMYCVMWEIRQRKWMRCLLKVTTRAIRIYDSTVLNSIKEKWK